MATVKGVWVFNSVISKAVIDEKVTFSVIAGGSLRQAYGIYMSGSVLYYRSATGNLSSPYNFSTNKWQADILRTIDFGTAEQTVSDDFYAWFTANAVRQVSGVTFDLSTLNLTGTHAITVKARGTGYISSPASNAVEYTV